MLADSVSVSLRVTELIYADGSGGLRADTVVPPASGARDAPLEVALAHVRRPPTARPARTPLPASAAPPPDRGYAEMRHPTLPYRLLAAFRIWGTMEYFHAYRRHYDESWDGVLRRFIPKFEATRDSVEYALTIAEMVSNIRDSHGFVSSPVLRNYWGVAVAPLYVRIVEGLPVVTAFLNDSAARAAGVSIGDVIVSVDGEAAAARLARRERYLAASTPQSLHWIAAGSLLAGSEGSVAVVQLRGGNGQVREVRLTRRESFRPNCEGCRTGEMLQILPGSIGYADLDRLPPSMVDSMFELFKDTRAIIFDMRGYPLGTAWQIAPRLTDRTAVGAAEFLRPVADGPHGGSQDGIGEQSLTMRFVQPLPSTSGWRYHRPTVMLIDERTISQAEHTGLFFEAANGTKFVGSPTTGANGDVTSFVVPGGIRVGLSGHDVRHADGRQLQRVGLKPDVPVSPTIAGIRAGRDEVLEAAVAYLARVSGAR